MISPTGSEEYLNSKTDRAPNTDQESTKDIIGTPQYPHPSTVGLPNQVSAEEDAENTLMLKVADPLL